MARSHSLGRDRNASGDISQAFITAESVFAKLGVIPSMQPSHAIGDLFVDARGEISASVMPDSLHLSKDGYRIWGEALLPLVSK
mgnify:CR=1 FL=1